MGNGKVSLCMNNGKNLRKEFETIDTNKDQVRSTLGSNEPELGSNEHPRRDS